MHTRDLDTEDFEAVRAKDKCCSCEHRVPNPGGYHCANGRKITDGYWVTIECPDATNTK